MDAPDGVLTCHMLEIEDEATRRARSQASAGDARSPGCEKTAPARGSKLLWADTK